MLKLSSKGSFKNTTSYLDFLKSNKIFVDLDQYGRAGVDALSRSTPVDTGETAHSWGYEIEEKHGGYAIHWYNTHKHNNVHIAVIIQYGHGTGTGGWVEGRDYINPAIQPLFDKIVDDIWKKVSNG